MDTSCKSYACATCPLRYGSKKDLARHAKECAISFSGKLLLLNDEVKDLSRVLCSVVSKMELWKEDVDDRLGQDKKKKDDPDDVALTESEAEAEPEKNPVPAKPSPPTKLVEVHPAITTIVKEVKLGISIDDGITTLNRWSDEKAEWVPQREIHVHHLVKTMLSLEKSELTKL